MAELARLAAWWADSFVTYRRLVLIAGSASPDQANAAAQVQRWEWLDDDQRLQVAEGMRAVSRIALDYQDVT